MTGQRPYLPDSVRFLLYWSAAAVVLFAAAPPARSQTAATDVSAEIRELREAVKELRAQVAELKQELKKEREQAPQLVLVMASPAEGQGPLAASSFASRSGSPAAEKGLGADFLRDSVIELGVDGYYGYNFNQPIGRVNLLRAYDVSSNTFSLNQASFILKRDPDPAGGRRFGARLDLQFGQATATLQGNAANEPRPEIYRPLFQVYGTYVAPLGKGLTIDFGKWASSIGIEGNYSKDQMNYSRSLWFDFLPFYHMGLRASYKVSGTLGLNYWLVNGAQQTEPFKGFKDQMFGVNLLPHKTVNWTINYYFGQEHPDVTFFPQGGAPPGAPAQQGIPFLPIPNAPDGRLHIIDSYLTWQAAPRLTVAVEGDYVIQRLLKNSAPAHTSGGALYLRYQAGRGNALAARAEYLSDRGGLFSGATQAIKEATLTWDHKVADGLLLRTEWRRDFSNRPFFLTGELGILSQRQNTATMGVIWWWGSREETW